MWTIPEHFVVRLGGNLYIDSPNLVTYKGELLFSIKRSDDTGILCKYS
jgi:hypothetical protein